MTQGTDQGRTPLLIVLDVVLQIGVSHHHPHVAQHLEQHPSGTSGTATAAQLLNQMPHLLSQESDDDLPVGERGVVIGYFANATAGLTAHICLIQC